MPYYALDHAFAARTDLNPTAKLIYSIIVDHIGKNATGWPGITKLCEESAVARPTVLRAIKRLEALGDLTVHRGRKGQGNHYSLPKSSNETLPVEPVTKLDRSSNKTLPEQSRNVTTSSNETLPKPPKRTTPVTTPVTTPAKKTVPIPENLNNETFLPWWTKWKAHRREIKKTLRPTTEASQLKKFATWGARKSVAAIEKSIEKGWTGFFEPDGNGWGGNGDGKASDEDKIQFGHNHDTLENWLTAIGKLFGPKAWPRYEDKPAELRAAWEAHPVIGPAIRAMEGKA